MSRTEWAEASHFSMNTVFTHRVYGKKTAGALHAVKKETVRLERLLSRFLHGSDISRINRAAGSGPVPVHEETFAVLTQAARFASHSNGLFDITIGPLARLWSDARKEGMPPEDEAIRRTLPLVNHASLAINNDKRAAGLERQGQSIDLGGIGKGYAGDRFLEVLRQHGVTSAYTNLGGNVVTLGNKPDGAPWRVGIRHPRNEGNLIGAVSVTGKAVVTSGDDQRFFMGNGGRRYHHILDPCTGYPANSGLISVTVVADSSMDADGISTMLFVAGLARGIPLLGRFEGAEAILIDEDLTIYITAGLRDSFQAAEGVETRVITQ